jgi:WhiB family redox-sensing transcriptional regulator
VNKTDWTLRACRDGDRELFFNENDPGPALAICFPCPIKQMCLDWALTQPERHGVWGGTTEDERKKLGYRKLRKRCPQCTSRELDSSLGYAQACRKCGVSWRTEEVKTPVAA